MGPEERKDMEQIKVFNAIEKPTELEKEEVVDFLHTHLQQYGDPKLHIRKAIDYSIKEFVSFGGFTLVYKEGKAIKGAVVVNHTGMGGYIPENILVYIAVHEDMRGKGLGRKLMEHTSKLCKGDIALHVERDNPAKRLYERAGFTNPYLEMRLKRS